MAVTQVLGPVQDVPPPTTTTLIWSSAKAKANGGKNGGQISIQAVERSNLVRTNLVRRPTPKRWQAGGPRALSAQLHGSIV